MRKQDRLKAIIREINLHNKVLSTDLSVLLNVSDDTIRRDLKELADLGQVMKVHGGAVSKSFVAPFNVDNQVYSLQAKQRIAEKTIASLFRNNMAILTEGGTTILELAKMIPSSLKATFFTISPQVAITLSEHSNLDVISIGGKLNKNSNLHTGASVINQLAEIKVDLAILGANAISAEEGLTDMDWEVVQVKKAIVRAAKRTAVICISEKLNTVQRIKICPPGQINHLITELSVNDPALMPYVHQDIGTL
jgi:DeoR/GlpR family transcriptional regulator of sugar metabolism